MSSKSGTVPSGRRRQSARSAAAPSARAAASGKANDGTVRRALAPAQALGHARLAEEARDDRDVPAASAATAAIASATSSARVTSGGVKITSRASTSGSSRSTRSVRSKSPARRAGDEVDRIAHRRVVGDEAPQLFLGRVARAPGLSSPAPTHASAARIPGPPAFDTIATASAPGKRLVREHHRRREQVFERVDADHAGLAEECVDCDVGRRERRGVRRRGATAGERSPALHRDDRLRPRNAARETRELARVPERLEVQEDHVGARILLPVLQEVVAAHVGLVPDRDELRDPEAERRPPAP